MDASFNDNSFNNNNFNEPVNNNLNEQPVPAVQDINYTYGSDEAGNDFQPGGGYQSDYQANNGYQTNNNGPQTPPPGDGNATTSLILGIIAVALWFFGVTSIGSVVLGIIGLMQASKAKKLGNTSTKRTAGFILSLIGLIGGSFVFIACIACSAAVGVAGCSGAFGDLSKYANDIAQEITTQL